MHEYLRWAIDRLREEYAIEWPPVDRASTLEFVTRMRRPEAAVILAEVGSSVVGVGAFRRLEPQVAEIKRMYVRPAARGKHIGSAILDRLLHEVRLDGNAVVRLDTIRFMSGAQRLYRSRGFTERPPYVGTEIPPELHPYWLFFERSI
jgi:GNAT superfamily N-acetyltransferase